MGDPADIAVLNDDPLGVPDEVFASMPVAATLVAGRFTYGDGLTYDDGGTVASEA